MVDGLSRASSSPASERRRDSPMLSPRIALACALALGAIPSALAQDTQRFRTDKVEVIVETVARDLQNPWGLAFLPDNRLLVTERPGRLRIVDQEGNLSAPIG